jgi:hypothetical protein
MDDRLERRRIITRIEPKMPAMGRRARARLLAIGSAAVWAGWAATASQAPQDIQTLVRLVGERVAEYQRRARSVMCVEESTVQPIQSDLRPDGFARTVESELRVEVEADGEPFPSARVIRDVRRINGRAPRERDQKDRAGCTDPNPLSPEPLAFLLPEHRDEYRFVSLRTATEKGRAVVMIDFLTAAPASRPELIEDERGHDDCFDWTGPLATKGRVWVDANTRDVLRVDRHLAGPVDVRVPPQLQRRHNLPAWIVIDRDDQTMRYKPVAFDDPDEIVLLPESVESLTVVRGGLQSTRRTETFRSYRRFLTASRVVKVP